MLAWYAAYVDLFRRLRGRPPTSAHAFCGGGGDAEGVRRSRGVPYGQDLHDQPAFRDRFGDGSFLEGDCTSKDALLRLMKLSGASVLFAGPPCQGYSTAGRSEVAELIPLVRDLLDGLGCMYAIENVKGAAKDLRRPALLYGAYFGYEVDRPRFYETNWEFTVDEYLEQPGLKLRAMTCLGGRRL